MIAKQGHSRAVEKRLSYLHHHVDLDIEKPLIRQLQAYYLFLLQSLR